MIIFKYPVIAHLFLQKWERTFRLLFELEMIRELFHSLYRMSQGQS